MVVGGGDGMLPLDNREGSPKTLLPLDNQKGSPRTLLPLDNREGSARITIPEGKYIPRVFICNLHRC